MDAPWHKASVQGTPIDITVTPNPNESATSEGYGVCTSDQIDDGRYLSTDQALAPPEFTAMYNDTDRSYIYAPYNCKIPHRTIIDVAKSIPSAKHFVFLGDSTMRGAFCARIWENIHGTVKDSVCDYMTDPETYLPTRWTDKTSTVELDASRGFTETRNVSISFIWNPTPEVFEVKKAVLLAMDPPPTHVVMNMGAYVKSVDFH
jgi:hypothetical protein